MWAAGCTGINIIIGQEVLIKTSSARRSANCLAFISTLVQDVAAD